MACPYCGGNHGASQVSQSDGSSSYFSTTKRTSDPTVPGGSFTSFGSKEPDGYHKTTIVNNADGSTNRTEHRGGGAFGGGFFNWAAGKVTGR